MKILVIGKGKMGHTLKDMYPDEIIKEVDNIEEINKFNLKVDGVIDFSHSSLLNETLSLCKKNKIPLVIGTTNLTKENYEYIENVKNYIPICLDSNYSLGIICLKKCIESLSSFTFDKIIITETHHKDKKDIPSGTALSLKKYLSKMFNNKIEIIANRKDDYVGIHQIDFINQGEIISIKHEACNREVFAKGAHLALSILKGKKASLYEFGDIING